jgi:hypothetical protein
LPAAALGAVLTFKGKSRFVSTSNITVRLSNGIVIDARLSRWASSRDQVQIALKIQSVWDDPVKRYHLAELARTHFLRAPSVDEVAQVNMSLSWQPGDNLLKPIPCNAKPTKAEDPEGAGRVREVNLARAAKTPTATGMSR